MLEAGPACCSRVPPISNVTLALVGAVLRIAPPELPLNVQANTFRLPVPLPAVFTRPPVPDDILLLTVQHIIVSVPLPFIRPPPEADWLLCTVQFVILSTALPEVPKFPMPPPFDV